MHETPPPAFLPNTVDDTVVKESETDSPSPLPKEEFIDQAASSTSDEKSSQSNDSRNDDRDEDSSRKTSSTAAGNVAAAQYVAKYAHGSFFPKTRSLCTAKDDMMFVLAWRPRFIVSHIEEIRMRLRKRIVLLCPNSEAYATSLELFASPEGQQLYGNIQVFLFEHHGNRATLTNGYYMLVAVGHYLRVVLADDCRVQLRLPPLTMNPSDPRHANLVEKRMDGVKVFVFDPLRAAVCSNPFSSVPKKKLFVVPAPIDTSQFYEYHHFLLSKAWRDDYVGTGITLPASNVDVDDAVTLAPPLEQQDTPATPTPTTSDDNDVGGATTERSRGGGVEEGETEIATSKRIPSLQDNDASLKPSSSSFTVSSAAIGGSATAVQEFSAMLESVVAHLPSFFSNLSTLGEMSKGPRSPKLALGLEPLLTNVTMMWLRSPLKPGSGRSPRQVKVMRFVQFPSTTFCPQFQAAARFCHRYATRPKLVVDYHHCDPRGPSPLTHHVALPSTFNDETFESMVQGMCHTNFPYKTVRIAQSAYKPAAVEVTPARYLNAWQSWQPVDSFEKHTRAKVDGESVGLPDGSALPACDGNHTRRNVVITVAAGYHADKVKWMTRTFLRYRRKCDIMVILVTRYSGEYASVASKKNGVYLIKLKKFMTTVPEGTWKLFGCPMVLSRIELLRYVLQHEIIPKWDPHYVLMIDARDTFFQSNPFEALARVESDAREQGHLTGEHKEDFLGMPAMSYGWGNMELRVPQRFLMNRQWATSLFPDAMFDAMRTVPLYWEQPTPTTSSSVQNASSLSSSPLPPPLFNRSSSYQAFPALCGGMYFGTARAMVDFFDIFVATAAASAKPCDANDQGLLLGLVPFGISVASFPHPVLLLDPLQSHFTNEPDNGLSIRSDAKAVTTINCQGEPMAVLHQFIPNFKGVVAQLKKQLSSKWSL